MILITYLGKNDFKNKQKLLITLKNNVLNTSIKTIIIFSEIDFMLPKLDKVKYIVYKKYDIEYFIEKSKRIDRNSNHILWTDPFVEFDYNLSKIKYNVKNENYLIFSRTDDISDNFTGIKFGKTSVEFKINSKSMDFKLKMDFSNVIEKKIIKEVTKVKRDIPKIEKKIDVIIEEPMEVSRKIDVVIVSINYNEYLEKSLKHNHKFFDNIIVVTHKDDKECMDLCFEYDNIKVVLSSDIVKDGKINKSIGINAGIESIDDPDWILVMDADIILNKKIDINGLNKNYLYGTGRYLCEDMDNYSKWMNHEILLDGVGKFESNRHIGYFQLFNYKKVQKYPESSYGRYSKSEWADVKMKQFFNDNQRETLRLGAIHLGKTMKEWEVIKFKNGKEKSNLKFHFLINGWNCEEYVNECIDSILNQNNVEKYDFDIHIIDDASTDNTYNKICEYENLNNVFIYRNDVNLGPAGTRYKLIMNLNANDNDVIILIDLDDSIKPIVLDVIYNEYINNKDLELTYGALEYTTGGTFIGGDLPKEAHINKKYEDYKYVMTHLRTFKVKLRRGLIEDLFKIDGKWLQGSTDVALMIMLMKETSNINAIKNIKTLLYNYRKDNPNSVANKIGKDKQFGLSDEIGKNIRNYFSSHSMINDIFDNVYVLNLDRQRERYLNIKRKLDNLKIKFERFSAIDGNDIDVNIKNRLRNDFKGNGMIENEYALGCLLSHMEIIKNAKKNKYKKILILEDDVIFHNDFKNNITKILSLPKWKLLYLGSSQYNWDIEMRESYYLSKKSLGTFAFAIDNSVFDEILNLYNKKLSIDNIYSNYIQTKYYGECFTLYPNLIIADVSESNIRNGRDQETHSIKMKWDLKKYNI